MHYASGSWNTWKDKMTKPKKFGHYSYIELMGDLVAVMMYDPDHGDIRVLMGSIVEINPDLTRMLEHFKLPFVLKCQGQDQALDPVRYGAGWVSITEPRRVDYLDMDTKVAKLFKHRVGVRLELDTPAERAMMST